MAPSSELRSAAKRLKLIFKVAQFANVGLLVSLLALFMSPRAGAQEPSVRLALVPETDQARSAVDVMTAEISKNAKVQLLERAEIEKVYREQGGAAANRNDLKLGRILGADGLLLLNVIRTPHSTNLLARLVAVKPGVVLTDGSFPWPLTNPTQWAEAVASGIDAFVPKLTLTAKDAVAISVVNLRSAVQSADEKDLEQQLKLLTIQRLSQERQLFVLERQKMQLLDEEKELKSDESAFWDGSYLLDGIVDQSGYSKDTVTINVRLTPPKGGASLAFEVSGKRANLTEVINALALKVIGLLNAQSSVSEWNAAAEAAQYFEESKWALRWRVFPEAQAAADAAWALGKRDMDCATMRIKAYEGSLNVIPIKENGSIDASIVDSKEKSNRDWVARQLSKNSNSCPTVLLEHNEQGISYTILSDFPNPQMIDNAMHALALYDQFSRNAPDGLLTVASQKSGWKNSSWYDLGIEVLADASRTLEYYYMLPKAQVLVADKLAELRALARSVDGWISQTPAVHDSYFVGERAATHDELANTIGEDGSRSPNIFRCEVRWGSLWQESPADCVGLYRKLMACPVFCYIHSIFWSHRVEESVVVSRADHDFEPPRLVAWQAQDRDSIPLVWKSFVLELDESTNVLLQLESRAIAFADAKNDQETALAFTNFFAALFANQDALVNNNVEQFYLEWGAGALVNGKTSGGIVTKTKESLNRLFYTNYYPKLSGLEQSYWTRTLPAKRFLSDFEKQKTYLKENKPYDFSNFADTFVSRNYTSNQALEIQPLVVAYKSNLVARSQGATGIQKGQFMGAIAQVGFLERHIDEILKPPASQPPSPPKVQSPPPAAAAKVVTAPPAPNKAPAPVTNVISVTRFLPIPLEGLPGDEIGSVTVNAHHWLEGKLVLDIQYGAMVYSFDTNGNWKGTSNVTFPAIALLDPVTEHWKVIGCPGAHSVGFNLFYHHTTLWHGDVFTSDGGRVSRFDGSKNAWQVLEIPDAGDCELFTVNDRLFAATANLILEILDGGASTRILASNRRQPPVSALDAQNLGTPALFAGPGQSLRAFAGNQILTWSNQDWLAVCPAPSAPKPPVISDDGIIFLADGWNAPAGVWHLAKESDRVEFWLGPNARRGTWGGPKANTDSRPAWKLPPGFSLARLSASNRGHDLYLMADHAKSQDILDEHRPVIIGHKTLAQDGYQAELLCFARNYPEPQEVFLKFDHEGAIPPVSGDNRAGDFMLPGTPSSWLLFSSNHLYCGRETFNAFGSGGGNSQSKQFQAGVWLIPLSQIDSEIVRQRRDQKDALARAEAQAKQARQNLLDKYDRNHNGVIEIAEREDALDDPAFIESELEAIDINHNGILDPEELAWFDANTNKVLESKELAGIEIAQRLLAEKLLRQFDADGGGVLDYGEFDRLR